MTYCTCKVSNDTFQYYGESWLLTNCLPCDPGGAVACSWDTCSAQGGAGYRDSTNIFDLFYGTACLEYVATCRIPFRKALQGWRTDPSPPSFPKLTISVVLEVPIFVDLQLQSSRLGLRLCMDIAVQRYRVCVLCGVDRGRLAEARRSFCAVRSATGTERCMGTSVLQGAQFFIGFHAQLR